ncbi:MAG TPA: flagellar biosynthesis anti-sigma factor FlgM [Candidatus Caccousia stercoris]|mgnify:FL=1|uniref:Flagellar biosynthesis anti-sigma factor FlgM n=1 Tax=Candidatus Caccousia stercoris TaxID=2840723 RepID=A0A9D1FQY6_9FIRM|nr:flagellar biosynthesis anti-sigma factor FlgM [Candidatus Caccousia stercoris]
MFTGINFDRAMPLSGAAPQKSVSSGAQRLRKERLHYDLFELSQRPEGEEKAIQELVGQISREVRTRPSRGELEELQAQIREGTYQPDAREIAARMLLIREEEL